MAAKKYDLEELREIRKGWVDIPEEAVPEGRREDFRRRKAAVDMYIDGANTYEISEVTGIARQNITRYVERCLERNSDGRCYGYEALLGFKRVRTEDRACGLFGKLFQDYPELEEYIIGCWRGDRKYTTEKNMNYVTLHSHFKKKCREIGIQDHEYPFNTENEGYVSMRAYIKAKDQADLIKAASRMDRDDRQKLMSTGIGRKYSEVPMAPYSCVQIDGHIIDLMYCVEILNEDGTIDRRPATRAWLIAVIDAATRTILGYSVSQEFNYNQYDVVEAFRNAVLPHRRPLMTVKGLEYPRNGGFPSDAFPELEYALFDDVMLDNAKAHLAHNTVAKLVDVLGCAVNFGPAAAPETRAVVERFFGTLETRGFHRLPATTGSSTGDLKRRAPEKKALRYDITFDEVVQLLYVLIAEYNNTPHSGIGGQAPLECLRRRVFESGMRPTVASGGMIEAVRRLDYITERRVVRGGRNGKRAHVNYEGAVYRCSELSATDLYLGRQVTLLVNPRDISEIEAYDEDGSYIGLLRAGKDFGTKSHSLKTRKKALELARERGRDRLEFDAPIAAYERHLNEKGKSSRRDATRADMMRREQGVPAPSAWREAQEESPAPVIPIKADVSGGMTEDEYYEMVWGGKNG